MNTQIAVVNSKGGCGKSTLVLSLVDVLQDNLKLDVEIVEHDLQKTATRAAKMGCRHKPAEWKQAGADYIIHDLPPYMDASTLSILKVCDIILVPMKVSDQDLLATHDIVELLVDNRMAKRAIIVINEVRSPRTNLYKIIKGSLIKNYSDIKIARTELSRLDSFKGVLRARLTGKAEEQILALVQELGILPNNK